MPKSSIARWMRKESELRNPTAPYVESVFTTLWDSLVCHGPMAARRTVKKREIGGFGLSSTKTARFKSVAQAVRQIISPVCSKEEKQQNTKKKKAMTDNRIIIGM